MRSAAGSESRPYLLAQEWRRSDRHVAYSTLNSACVRMTVIRIILSTATPEN